MELSTKELFDNYAEIGDFVKINTVYTTMAEPDQIVDLYERESAYIIETNMTVFNLPKNLLWQMSEEEEKTFIANDLEMSIIFQ